jgi:hypothetical protein
MVLRFGSIGMENGLLLQADIDSWGYISKEYEIDNVGRGV